MPNPALRRLMLIACLLLSSCGWLMPPPQLRGNKVDPDSLKELTPGTSTKADVSAVIGSPTARDTFDDNTWLYISELTQQRIGRVLGELQQNVVVLNFDDKGVLKTINKYDKADVAAGYGDRANHAFPGHRGFVHAAASGEHRPLQPARGRRSSEGPVSAASARLPAERLERP